MYLIINGNRHTVSRRVVKPDQIRFLTVTPEPTEVSGTIQMYDNSGFLISEDNADSFLRYTYTGTLLTLTNIPEPVPVEPDPNYVPEPTTDELMDTLLGVSE